MSELAMQAGAEREGAFSAKTMALVLAVGILAFVALLLLGAYAPDLRSGRNGGAHALSTGATGYAALVELARATGRNPRIVRSEGDLDTEDLVVLTPENGAVPLGDVLARRETKATLVVFPKWFTAGDPAHPGWVKVQGIRYDRDPEQTLAPTWKLDIRRHRVAGTPLKPTAAYSGAALRFHAPGGLQTAVGKEVKAIVTDAKGEAVVAQLGDKPLYILTDPDLLSNAGMADLDQARSALALLDFLNTTDNGGIAFDVTLNGLGRSKSPLKLIFDPPFLATTLALAAALLLAGIHACIRFGPPRRPERALAFGKRALVDNTAALVRKARREAALGARYAAIVRERALAYFAAPHGLAGDAADAWLDRVKAGRPFSPLARAADEAGDRHALLRAARALHDWERETIR